VRLLFTPLGSTGDVQPMLALGRALRAQGHEVRQCAPSNFRPLVEAEGFAFFPFAADVQARFDDGRAMMGHNLRAIRAGLAMLRGFWVDNFSVVDAAADGVDAILGAGLCISGASVADRLRVPYWHVAHMPTVLESSHHAVYNSPWQGLPRSLNWLLWRVHFAGQNAVTLKQTNEYRASVGLAPVPDAWRHLFARAIIAMDRELAPVPPDVKTEYLQVGYLQSGEIRPLPEVVERFVGNGGKPVYVGFGSMTDPEPERTVAAIEGALAMTGRRAIVGRGWASAKWAGDGQRVLVVDGVDHRALFPRMAAVIHHGGAGTTYTAARAGAPQIIVPHAVDQFYWARRIRSLGLGPKAVPKGKLGAHRLARAIREATGTAAITDAAARMRDALAKNDGLTELVSRLVPMIEQATARLRG
jgi:UDP:flavonoid glycosyltransferase YjiC (YdhE family)